MDARLRDVFGHEVSRLAAVPGESAKPPASLEPQEPEDRVEEFVASAATGLPVSLSDPESIRQA
ncbi:MAG: hypothetical protein GTN90_02060, partial [Xanthomonadales bacterium]|nr:hypothetical protein [Xanthomonadales bacterium]